MKRKDFDSDLSKDDMSNGGRQGKANTFSREDDSVISPEDSVSEDYIDPAIQANYERIEKELSEYDWVTKDETSNEFLRKYGKSDDLWREGLGYL